MYVLLHEGVGHAVATATPPPTTTTTTVPTTVATAATTVAPPTTTTISSHPVSTRQVDPLGDGFFPHFVGGMRGAWESIPSSRALRREDTASWNDGRSRTHEKIKNT